MEKVKVSELRKGNIINGVYQLEEANGMHYTICKFLGYHPFDNYIYVESKDGIEEFIQFNPVILDEEILLKCGFDHFGDELVIKVGHRFFITYDKNGGGIFTENTDPDEETAVLHEHIKYLHQLQNLYFALTGQELNTSGL